MRRYYVRISNQPSYHFYVDESQEVSLVVKEEGGAAVASGGGSSIRECVEGECGSGVVVQGSSVARYIP